MSQHPQGWCGPWARCWVNKGAKGICYPAADKFTGVTRFIHCSQLSSTDPDYLLFVNLILTCVSLSRMLRYLNSWYHQSHSKKRGFWGHLGQRHADRTWRQGRGPVYSGTLGPPFPLAQCSACYRLPGQHRFWIPGLLLPKVSLLSLGLCLPERTLALRKRCSY